MNKQITITDGFFKNYKKLVEEVMIPYQYKVLHDVEKSHAIRNLEIAAGLESEEFEGWVFQDSDVYKWLEAVGYILEHKEDVELKTNADKIVELIAKAQEEDGYIDTYFQIKHPERKYKRLFESHELYCAGHFFEAAVAYYKGTKNQLVLDMAIKLANQIDNYFGPEDGKFHIADGHEEVEIGLLKLYELTNDEKYLNLANYLLDVRGIDTETYQKQIDEETALGYNSVYNDNPSPIIDVKMYQAHKPIVKQDEAVGHAVRFGYMATALAENAKLLNKEEQVKAAKRLWDNVVNKRMYITGGIGSTASGEAFTLDYDLPNDTAYSETCAAISMIFFAKQMLNLEINSEYADVMERALFNTTIAGMSLDAKHFYYVNPLEVDPQKCKLDPNKQHVKPIRQEWFGCACCPPNIARLISSLEDYIYTENDNGTYINQFIPNTYSTDKLKIELSTSYPHDGDIKLIINSNEITTVGLRIPNWCEKYSITVDGKLVELDIQNGYAMITEKFSDCNILVHFEMAVRQNYSNIKVSNNIGKVAISRGPLVYCIEEVDNGKILGSLLISSSPVIKTKKEEILGGIVSINLSGYKLENETNQLYSYSSPKLIEQTIKLIPYYAWANRGENEMRVWVNKSN
ncbi:MAG: glycoside hydrolase family 127 protein [Coprobacillaceae bacterium]